MSMQNCSHGGGEGGGAGGGEKGGQKPCRHGGLGGGEGGELRDTSPRVHISHLSEIVQIGSALCEVLALRLASSHATQKSPKRHRGGSCTTPQSAPQSGIESNVLAL